MDDLCLHCGILHPAGAQCHSAAAVVGVAGDAAETGARGPGPRLGPWVLAVRRRLPAAGGGDGSSGKHGAAAMERGSTSEGGWIKPPRVARRPPPVGPNPVPTAGGRETVRGKKGAMGAANPFSLLAMEGEGARGGGSLCPPGLPKRARPNEDLGSQASVQAASSSKSGPGKAQARPRKLIPKLSRGKEVVMGQVQSSSESESCKDEAGVFMFTASDRGGPGIMECPNTSTEGCQLAFVQAVDPMLVSAQAVPRSDEHGVPLRGDHTVEVGTQEAPRGSPVLDHDMAVSRLRQAIQGDGEGPPVGRVAVVDSVVEDLMEGEEEAVQISHPVSL